MHEMSLMQGVLDIIEDASTGQFTKVTKVWLEIGALSGVDPAAMAFCFDAVMHDTLAQDAELEIIDKPGEGWCMKCSRPVPISARYDPCPFCGCHQIQVTGGEEMRVKEIEVE